MPQAIQIRQTGGPEVLNWTGAGSGAPAPGQREGVNYIDVYPHGLLVAGQLVGGAMKVLKARALLRRRANLNLSAEAP